MTAATAKPHHAFSFEAREPQPLQSVRIFFCCPGEFFDGMLTPDVKRELRYSAWKRECPCSIPSKSAPPWVTEQEFGGVPQPIPSNPDALIDFLRLERYPGCRLNRLESALKAIYYACRPLTTGSIRSYIQRIRARKGFQRQFPHWPVDTTVEHICQSVLLQALQEAGVDRIPFIWFWPQGAMAAVTITHDVETELGLRNCKSLMDLDASLGFKSSFQIVPQDRYPVSEFFLDELREAGNEIGVQDLNHDGRLFDSLAKFRDRAALINRYAAQYGAKGFRSAILYRRPEWLRYLDFSFDMSMPNVAPFDPQPGGCCTVMPFSIDHMTEIPLTTVQDYTLFYVLRQKSSDLWRTQIETIVANHGLVSILAHPDYLVARDTRAVYSDLLILLHVLCDRKALWVALPSEIDAWWRARQKMTIVRQDGSWRIRGEQAERARLAFASMGQDGRLLYELSDDSCSQIARGAKAAASPTVWL